MAFGLTSLVLASTVMIPDMESAFRPNEAFYGDFVESMVQTQGWSVDVMWMFRLLCVGSPCQNY